MANGMSLTLGAERYGRYFPLLEEMERQCFWNYENDMEDQLQN